MPNPELYAGALDKRVTLLRPIYNDYQDEIVDWEPIANVWAAITPNQGQETNEAGRMVAVTYVPMLIRYRSDIDARWRIALGSRVFEIEALLNALERKAHLQLSCKEVL